MPENEPTSAENNGKKDDRGIDGRFVPGNKAGLGNPRHKWAHLLHAEMERCITKESLAKIIYKLISLAEEGDTVAAKEVLDRVFGKARQNVDINGALEILKLYSQSAPVDEV